MIKEQPLPLEVQYQEKTSQYPIRLYSNFALLPLFFTGIHIQN